MTQISPLSNSSTIQRINVEDLPGAPEWVPNLLSPINQFIQTTNSALEGNLQIPNNIAGQVNSVTFTTSDKYVGNDQSTFNDISFRSTLAYNTRVLMVGRIQILSAQVQYVSNVVTISDWTEEDRQITIKFVTGLQPNTTYMLTTLAF